MIKNLKQLTLTWRAHEPFQLRSEIKNTFESHFLFGVYGHFVLFVAVLLLFYCHRLSKQRNRRKRKRIKWEIAKTINNGMIKRLQSPKKKQTMWWHWRNFNLIEIVHATNLVGQFVVVDITEKRECHPISGAYSNWYWYSTSYMLNVETFQ